MEDIIWGFKVNLIGSCGIVRNVFGRGEWVLGEVEDLDRFIFLVGDDYGWLYFFFRIVGKYSELVFGRIEKIVDNGMLWSFEGYRI